MQQVQFEQQAEELDIEVTEKQVDDRLEEVSKQYFGGDKKKYEQQLKEQGSPKAQVRQATSVASSSRSGSSRRSRGT